MRGVIIGLVLALAGATPALAQQIPDAKADVSVARPMWPKGAGPVVAIDEGHNNFHTAAGRYAPFVALIGNDGYRVASVKRELNAGVLDDIQVLVIANAEGEASGVSAFSADEIAALRTWVEGGGSLLLIADHAPFSGAAADLGKAFGFTFADGYAKVPRDGPLPDIFRKADGLLGDHAVTRGRAKDEAVDRVGAFTGSAFTAPAGATPILILPRGTVVMPEKAGGGPDPDAPTTDASGALQGAVMTVGKGRIAVFGEAAMFSAQVAGPNEFRMGFNNPAAPRNRQFTINLMRWLAGALPD